MPRLKSIEPPCTDPYARWCGRGGAVRLPPIPIVSRRASCAQSRAPVRQTAHRQPECALERRRRRASRRRRPRSLQRPCFPLPPPPCIRLGATRHRRTRVSPSRSACDLDHGSALRAIASPALRGAVPAHRAASSPRATRADTMSVVRESRTCSMGITRRRTSQSTSATTSVPCLCPRRRRRRRRCRRPPRHHPDRRCRDFDTAVRCPADRARRQKRSVNCQDLDREPCACRRQLRRSSRQLADQSCRHN